MTIPFLNDIEKLINEHGSAVILKERIELARDKFALIEKERDIAKSQIACVESEKSNLKIEITNLQSNNLILLRENEALRLDLSQAEEKIRNLEKQLAEIKHSNPYGYVCDHCGSKNLTGTGSKPDPTFGPLGIKQGIFLCNDCGKESSFTPSSRERNA